MELADVVEALAHLSSEIDQLRAKQNDYHVQSWERLEQWSKTNEHLTICLREQSQANRESTGIYQALVQHLLTLAQTIQQLTEHTSILDGSSKNLAQYLVEQQVPQLKQLEANSQQLQVSSSNLESYLKTEQSNRLKMLENSLRTLLEMLEIKQGKKPSSQTATSLAISTKPESKQPISPSQKEPMYSPQKKWSFNVEMVATSALASSMSMALLLLLLSAIGLIAVPTRAVEAPEQNTAAESVEPALGN
ncbi:MAG: hypothetical protein WBA76_05090 [Phormidesmis sp.]